MWRIIQLLEVVLEGWRSIFNIHKNWKKPTEFRWVRKFLTGIKDWNEMKNRKEKDAGIVEGDKLVIGWGNSAIAQIRYANRIVN